GREGDGRTGVGAASRRGRGFGGGGLTAEETPAGRGAGVAFRFPAYPAPCNPKESMPMPATRRIPRIILAGAIATALAACSPASDPVAGATPARAGTPATAPAQPAPPPATIDDVAVASFLASTYGPAAGPTGEW